MKQELEYRPLSYFAVLGALVAAAVGGGCVGDTAYVRNADGTGGIAHISQAGPSLSTSSGSSTPSHSEMPPGYEYEAH